MIVCPNCNHQNPDGATQCEACYTPLPAMTACPTCGAPVQTDANFCGQCGTNLNAIQASGGGAETPTGAAAPDFPAAVPDPAGVAPTPDFPVAAPDPVGVAAPPDPIQPEPLVEPDPLIAVFAPPSQVPHSVPLQESYPAPETPDPTPVPPTPVNNPPATPSPTPVSELEAPRPASPPPGVKASQTQLQQQTARLVHTRTNTFVELPAHLSVIHLGKPNDRIPPDIDVSGFADSEVVSRIHADIRVEGDTYYIEDVGSSNGTYINNIALPPGNRHRLRSGDRISLGKGDKVSFLFQLI